MKKIISCILAVIMLVSVAVFTTTTASAEENLFKVFEEPISNYISICGTWPYTVEKIAYWAGQQYSDNDYIPVEWDGKTITKSDFEDGYSHYRQYPADKFDSLVKEVFEFEGDFRELVKENKNEFQDWVVYHEEDNTYIVVYDFARSSDIWVMLGYQDYGHTVYSLYFQRAGWFETIEEIDEALKEENLTHETAKDRIVPCDEGGYYLLNRAPQTIYDENYVRVDVKYEGKYLKIQLCDWVSQLPAKEDLIVRESKKNEIKYEVEKGIKIEGDNLFPDNTVITAKSVSNGKMFDITKKALAQIVSGDKIAVFDISAIKDNAVVQPSGKVKVVFDLPSNLSADNLKMFYISEEGKKEEIKITVDKANKKVTAELNHFSTYVLCNVKTEIDNSVKSPKTGDNSNILIALMILSLSVIACSSVAVYKNKKEM